MSLTNDKKESIKRLFFPHIKLRDRIYSFIVNLKLFPLSIAIKMPIYFRRDVKINKSYRGCIEFAGNIYKGMIKIGFSGASNARIENSFFYCDDKSKIYLGENISIARGAKIVVAQGGELHIGNDVYINSNSSIQSESRIDIGADTLIGWNVSIRDTDGHSIYENGYLKEKRKPIIIGNHVWIASETTILKGNTIPNGSVIACNSLVCSVKEVEENSLYGGIPAKLIKHNIAWEK